MTRSHAESASHHGGRRYRPTPVECGYTVHGELYFLYADHSSLIVGGQGDLNQWLWQFRAEEAPFKQVARSR
jgi:hypothetical protein